MNISESGLAFIARWEGEGLTVYKDVAGKDTIGVGHLILPGENFSGGITIGQSRALLHKDVAGAESLVNKQITVPLTQAQYDALVSLAFNVPSALTTGTLDNLINSGATEAQIRQKWGQYSYAGGQYYTGLANRRAAEIDMYFGGTKKKI